MAKKQSPHLNITCTSTDCANNLHCFKATRAMKRDNLEGRCRECGIELVDWERVRSLNLDDATFTFEMLRKELIRHSYWHREIDLRAVNHAKRKGKTGMRVAAKKRIRSSIGPAQPYRDGQQTPKDGNALYYAQHATACCCRKCAEYWHGIEQGRPLSEAEIDYFTKLVCLYIDDRLPFLTENGERVPPIRRSILL
ncbi:MAG: DUF4186 family protein [Planctomycetes bacterium]|nr:DUF4186 family protein [Planctomycetota bacterium]